MQLNIEAIKELAVTAYTAHVHEAFGSAGQSCLIKVIDAVKLIYQHCPPESLSGTLTVIMGVNSTPLSPVLNSLGGSKKVFTYEDVGGFLRKAGLGSHSFVEVSSDGSFQLLNSLKDYNLTDLARTSVVYRYQQETDQILAKNYRDFIPKISQSLLSNFATPTISNLESALDHYSKKMAAESQCRILAEVWELSVNGPRLVLVNRPESLMRDSLIQALQLLLRDANVRPEHNSDETKPVDIKVEWFGSGASALIEVKWLGKSTSKPRDKTSTGLTYLEYRAARAQEGANQLADYLDREVRHSHLTTARGYLVVFDARRKNVKGKDDRLIKEDALHYENSDLTFNPDHSKTRADFSYPYRFFLKPRASDFLQS